MHKALLAVGAAAVLVLGGCSSATDTQSPPAPAAAQVATGDVVAALGLSGKTPREIVDALDSSTAARPMDFGASVRGTQLVLKKGDAETTLQLPADLYHVSIAPYRTHTHECYFHSLATCKGELAGEDVKVLITDDSGKVLVDEATKTHANGFVGFWLPKDIKGTITVEHDGHVGTAAFATTAGSATCVTTLQLT
jgi:hypothetical protein